MIYLTSRYSGSLRHFTRYSKLGLPFEPIAALPNFYSSTHSPHGTMPQNHHQHLHHKDNVFVGTFSITYCIYIYCRLFLSIEMMGNYVLMQPAQWCRTFGLCDHSFFCFLRSAGWVYVSMFYFLDQNCRHKTLYNSAYVNVD